MADGALSAEPAEAAAKEAPPAPDAAKPTQYVDHTYTDYARVHEDDLKLLREAGDVKGAPCTERLDEMRRLGGPQKATAARRTKKAGKDPSSYSPVALPFPGKLLDVLDRGDLNAIVGWQPHGRAFIVRDPKLFTVEVLSRFFRQTKILSFTRQLNLWGFKRITCGVDAGAYYHELFLPGRPHLALRMKRVKIKGTGIRPIPNPQKEPNFYYHYPRVQLVKRAPAPLPPLPHERIALAMSHQGVGPAGAALPASGLAQLSSAAAAASRLESSLLGSPNPPAEGARASGLLGSLSASGKVHDPALASQTALNADYVAYLHHRASASAAAAAAKPKSTLELELASGLYLHRQQRAQAAAAAASASAPQTLNLLRTRSPEDEVAIANRRLLERLLEQPSASLSTVQGTSLFGRGSGRLAAPAGLSSSVGHHPLLAAQSRVSLPLSLASSLPSSLGSLTASSLRPAVLPCSGVASAMSQVSVLTNALQEARLLEEMARRHRVAALETALKQRM